MYRHVPMSCKIDEYVLYDQGSVTEHKELFHSICMCVKLDLSYFGVFTFENCIIHLPNACSYSMRKLFYYFLLLLLLLLLHVSLFLSRHKHYPITTNHPITLFGTIPMTILP